MMLHCSMQIAGAQLLQCWRRDHTFLRGVTCSVQHTQPRSQSAGGLHSRHADCPPNADVRAALAEPLPESSFYHAAHSQAAPVHVADSASTPASLTADCILLYPAQLPGHELEHPEWLHPDSDRIADKAKVPHPSCNSQLVVAIQVHRDWLSVRAGVMLALFVGLSVCGAHCMCCLCHQHLELVRQRVGRQHT
jgi:hypothetical protein